MSKVFRPKRGTKSKAISQLTGSNVLKAGEIFFEIPDSGEGKEGNYGIKMGDGKSNYDSLPYIVTNTADTIANEAKTAANAARVAANEAKTIANTAITTANEAKDIVSNIKYLKCHKVSQSPVLVSKGQQYLITTDVTKFLTAGSTYLCTVPVITKGNTAYIENIYCYLWGVVATFNTSDTFAFDLYIFYL